MSTGFDSGHNYEVLVNAFKSENPNMNPKNKQTKQVISTLKERARSFAACTASKNYFRISIRT